MANLTELMRDIRHWSLKDQVFRLNQVLRGHYAYYGIAGNVRSLRKVYRFVERYWHKMLCSRSWAARITWAVFHRLRDLFPLQRPTIYLTYGQMQSRAVLPVGAGKAPRSFGGERGGVARSWRPGGVQQWAFLPRSEFKANAKRGT